MSQFGNPQSAFYAQPGINPADGNFENRLKQLPQDQVLAGQFQQQLKDPKFLQQLQQDPALNQQFVRALNDKNVQGVIVPMIQQTGDLAPQYNQLIVQGLVNGAHKDADAAAAAGQTSAGGNTAQNGAAGQNAAPAQPPGFFANLYANYCKCLSIDYYKEYFDVTTEVVRERLEVALVPTKGAFFKNDRREDMYGPFWVYTTLIFTLAAAGNLSSYLSTGTQAGYNFSYVPQAASFVYIFGFAFPVGICYMLRTFGSPQVEYTKIICLYGYGSAVYIPVSLACALPYSSLQWALMIYAMGSTTYFLWFNLCEIIDKYSQDQKRIVIGVLAGLQIFVLVLYKLYFFDAIYASSPGGTTSSLAQSVAPTAADIAVSAHHHSLHRHHSQHHI